MNNDITEDYCSFEIAKLLKEKGFLIPVYSFYGDDTIVYTYSTFMVANNEKDKYERPTHALVVKWIRENFNWNIEIGYRNSHKDFRAEIYPMFPNTLVGLAGRHNTHEKATEAALLYTLTNLI